MKKTRLCENVTCVPHGNTAQEDLFFSSNERTNKAGMEKLGRVPAWSRTSSINPINALSGVAYGTRSLIPPLLVVRNLCLDQAAASRFYRGRLLQALQIA